MNPYPCKPGRSGITLLEVMILIALLAVLAYWLFGGLRYRSRVPALRIHIASATLNRWD